MEINQQELPNLLARNLYNWVGIRGKVEDTEGYIHSTRLGYVEL